MEKGSPFPMEYVKWHKALLEYFSTKVDYNFIWKGFFLPNQKFDLMSAIINQAEYNNIIFRSDRFERYFNKSNKYLYIC